MAEIRIKRGSTRWWFAVLLLLAMTLTFVAMGRWQLGRAQERDSIADEIARGRKAAPVALSQKSGDDNLHAWQAVTATGRWLPQYSVLLDNRALHGRPGLWLAMPLELDDGAKLLVLRAWVPRPLGNETVALDIKQPADVVQIAGEVATHVPRMYELQADGPISFEQSILSDSATSMSLNLKKIPWRQNLSVADMAAAMQQPLLPFVVLQTNEDQSLSVLGQSLPREWPEPSVDADKNRGYAMQWFMFATIAFGALVILVWRSRRHATMAA